MDKPHGAVTKMADIYLPTNFIRSACRLIFQKMIPSIKISIGPACNLFAQT